MHSNVWKTIGVVAIASVALAACGDDDDETTQSASGDGGIDVLLSEWAVEAPATAEAGSITFNAVNEGGEVHELVIVRDDSFDDWEKDETGKVLEDQFAEEDFIGEIEEFDAGTTESGTFDLDAGTYVLFCNITEEEEDGEWESHFDEGMVTTISIE